jgi:hypothetical protein
MDATAAAPLTFEEWWEEKVGTIYYSPAMLYPVKSAWEAGFAAGRASVTAQNARRPIFIPSFRVVPPPFDGTYPVTPDSAGKSSERAPNLQQ